MRCQERVAGRTRGTGPSQVKTMCIYQGRGGVCFKGSVCVRRVPEERLFDEAAVRAETVTQWVASLLCSRSRHRMCAYLYLRPARPRVKPARSSSSAVVGITPEHLWQASTPSSPQKLTLSAALVMALLSPHRGRRSCYLRGSRF